jgi:hypothetical protein
MALKKGVTAIESYILIGSISKKQDMLFGLDTTYQTYKLYNVSYIYYLNETGAFVKKTKLKDSVTGYAFNAACFLLNDSYLAVLQIRKNTTIFTHFSLFLIGSILQGRFEDNRCLQI